MPHEDGSTFPLITEQLKSWEILMICLNKRSSIIMLESHHKSGLNILSMEQNQLNSAINCYVCCSKRLKVALRWIVGNADTYSIDVDEIAVGGASAGSITTIALGISDESDFRDEISIDEDPTLSTTNLNETYDVKSMVYFWGSNVKVELYNSVYEVDRYDENDPELFMAHGDGNDPVTPYEGALALQDIYDSLGFIANLLLLKGMDTALGMQ